MRRKKGWLTAVCLAWLCLLAACGGMSNEDVGAVGSETVGDILPTPMAGIKAQPTRLSSLLLRPDILIVAPADLFTAEHLEAMAAALAQSDAYFGLSLYGNGLLPGGYDLTADTAALTAVLSQPLSAEAQPLSLAEALAAALQLPGWRTESAPRLLFLMTDGAASPEAQPALLALAATAAGRNIRIFPVLMGLTGEPAAPFWQELAQSTDGRVLAPAETPLTEDSLAALVFTVFEQGSAGTGP